MIGETRRVIRLGARFWLVSAFIIVIALAGTVMRGTSNAQINGDSVSIDTSRTEAAHSGDESTQQAGYKLKIWRSLRSHLHNKLIHVPIGFTLSAFLISVLALKLKNLEPAIRWLVLCAALGSLAAFLTGTSQASAYDGSTREWVVDVHRTLGISTAIVLWIWTITQWAPGLRRWSLAVGTVAVVLITVTGFFGGVVAHG